MDADAGIDSIIKLIKFESLWMGSQLSVQHNNSENTCFVSDGIMDRILRKWYVRDPTRWGERWRGRANRKNNLVN